MVFENEAVLQAILEVCEPDTDIRISCMDLSGLPLEYAFAANGNLNYLKDMGSLFYNIHVKAETAISKGDIVNKPYPELDWLIGFSLELGEHFERHQYLQDIISRDFQGEYLIRYYTYMDEFMYEKVTYTGDDFFKVSSHKAFFSPMLKALTYHKRYFHPTLGFLARGINISKDASQNEVEAWLDTFKLFSKHKIKAIEQRIAKS